MQISDDQNKALTTAGLNLIAQALTIYDSDLRLAVCNAPFQSMFDLPDALVTPGAPFEDTIRHLAQTGEYGEVTDVDAFVAERVDQARAFVPHYMDAPAPMAAPSASKARPCPKAAGSRSIPTSPTPNGKRPCCGHARMR